MANLFLCGGSGGGGGSIDASAIVSKANAVSATSTSTATNTVNFTAPSNGILIAYYQRWKYTTSYGCYGAFTVTQNGTSVTTTATTTAPAAIVECAEGDAIVIKNTCYLKSSSTTTSYSSGTKYAYVAYTFIPT